MSNKVTLLKLRGILRPKQIWFSASLALTVVLTVCQIFSEVPHISPQGWDLPARSPSLTDIQSGDLYAVVVGISKYRDNRIPALKVSDKDARSVSDFLKTQKGLFKNLNVSLLQNEQATAEALQRELVYGLRKAGKDDTVIIFLSGHGVDDPKSPGEFFFLPYDADPEYVAVRGIHMNRQWFTERLDAKRVLIIADACHAGGFAGPGMKRLPPSLDKFMGQFKQSEGRVFITSSRADEYSRESTEQGHSLFTHYLLEGLSGKAADQAGIVYLKSLYDYVYRMTKKASDGFQSPQMEGKVVGEFPLGLVNVLHDQLPLAAPYKSLEQARKSNTSHEQPRDTMTPSQQLSPERRISEDSRVVAIVNSDLILKSDIITAKRPFVRRLIDPTLGIVSSSQMPTDIEILNELIAFRLLEQEADKLNVTLVESSVEKALESIRNRNNFSQKQFSQFLASNGMSYDDYKKLMKKQFRILKLIETRVRPNKSVKEFIDQLRIKSIVETKLEGR